VGNGQARTSFAVVSHLQVWTVEIMHNQPFCYLIFWLSLLPRKQPRSTSAAR